MSLSNYCSNFAPVNLGIPQGSVPFLIPFSLCIKPLSTMIDIYNQTPFICNDLQLEMSGPDRISMLLNSLSCICDVKAVTTVNILN